MIHLQGVYPVHVGACTNAQLDLYTQIMLSVLSVYQSANKSICNDDTRWKLKKKVIFHIYFHACNSIIFGQNFGRGGFTIGHELNISVVGCPSVIM
jgi:hypothetical protein